MFFWFDFLSYTPAMPEHLGSITVPLAILPIARLYTVNLPSLYKSQQLLLTANNVRRQILAECLIGHQTHDVVKQDAIGKAFIPHSHSFHYLSRVTVMIPLLESDSMLHFLSGSFSFKR